MQHPWTAKILEAMKVLDGIEGAEVTVSWPANLIGIDPDGHHYEPANAVKITIKGQPPEPPVLGSE